MDDLTEQRTASGLVMIPSGLRVHYQTWDDPADGPRGTPVLLIHGLQGRGALWTPVAEGLAAQGFHVVAADIRGHGGSDHAADYAIEAFAADAAALLDRLGLAPAHVIGHSLGGAIAWTLAAHYPEHVRRLVIEDQHPDANPQAAAPSEEWARGWTWRFASREEGMAYLQASGRTVAWWAPSLVPQPDGGWGWAFDGRTIVEITRRLYEWDRWDDLQRVQAPTLLIRGAESTHLRPDVAQRMVATLPQGRLLTLPGGHWVHKEPAPYLAAVTAFLRADDR